MHKPFLYIASMLVVSIQSLAQDNKSAVVPEYMNQLYYVADSNKLSDLEKTDAAMKSKSKLAGFGGASSAYIMDGSNSKIQIGNPQPSFVIRMDGMMMDASQMIRLYRFEKKDKSRESVISKSGVMGKNSNTNTDGIKFNVKKTDKGVYWLIPEEPLSPGEYGFVNMMSPGASSSGRAGSPTYTAYAFAIR